MFKISARDNKRKDDYDKKVAVFDFDGTIAEMVEFPKIGKPIQKTVDKIKELKEKGYDIIVSSCRFSDKISSRKEADEQLRIVGEWLDENEIPYDELWKDAKPLAKLYIDDKALNVKDIDKIDEYIKMADKFDLIMNPEK